MPNKRSLETVSAPQEAPVGNRIEKRQGRTSSGIVPFILLDPTMNSVMFESSPLQKA
jgi:hypothetical protein